MSLKTYLGDGVYAAFDGFGFRMTLEDGLRAYATIYFEPETLEAFEIFVKRIKNMTPEEIEKELDQENPAN